MAISVAMLVYQRVNGGIFQRNQRDPSIDETPSFAAFAAFALGETSQAHGPCDAMIELVEVEIETIWGYHGYNSWLVVFRHPSEKYESQWEGLSHIRWKIKLFQTTNQIWI